MEEENGERKGGRGEEEEEGGSWLGAQKAEVGVVFPVNTELQRVRGEGLSHANAEKRAAGRKKKNLVCLKMDLASHTRSSAQHQPAALLLFFKFQTLNSRSIDFLIEAAAALTVAFNPEPQLLAWRSRNRTSLHRLRTGLSAADQADLEAVANLRRIPLKVFLFKTSSSTKWRRQLASISLKEEPPGPPAERAIIKRLAHVHPPLRSIRCFCRHSRRPLLSTVKRG